MNIFYYAFQMYQFSYSKSIYEKLGGTYVVKKRERWRIFKRYFRGMNLEPEYKTFLNTPRVIIRPLTKEFHEEGVIFSHSNINIKRKTDKCVRIFIGHGTGDKPYGGNRKGAQNLLNYEYIFLSGPKHLERLKDAKVSIPPERLIKIGNMRFDAIVNGQIDKTAVRKRLGLKDTSRPTVLYAPTWKFGNGTFDKYVKKFCRELSRDFNLIIRPHSHDAKHIPEIKIWAKLMGLQNIYFSNPSDLRYCDTMNDFAVSDIMISDTSSVLYEFLITGNPLIVIDNQYKDLHKMPDNMNIMNFVDTYDGTQNLVDLIHRNLSDHRFKKDHQRMLNDCFYFNDGKSTQRAIDFLETLDK
ncbi:CDP-glycerol glycerophosphotransferase family protein [Candidatus Cloacimonadota bacterium]